MRSQAKFSRRTALKKSAIGAGILVGSAGCLGGDETSDGGDGGSSGGGTTVGNGDGGSSEWPPAGGRIEINSAFSPGSYTDIMAVEAANLIGRYLPDGDDLDIRYQNLAGAGGITASNYMNNARADGSTISVTTRGPLLNNPIVSPEQVKYDPLDFRYPAAARSFTRSIAISHHTQDVTDHFQWSWERFVEEAPDLRFAFLGVGHGSHVFGSLYHHFHPDLDLDTANEQNFLHYGGGGEARAAIERGEADVYQGSFSGQYANDEFYYTQFVATDDRFENSFNAGMYGVDDRAVTLAETDLAQDEVQKIVDMVLDGQLFQLPPGTSDEVYDIWVDAIDQLFQDDDWIAAMSNIAGDTPIDLFFSPELEIDEVIAQGWQTRLDLEDLLNDLF